MSNLNNSKFELVNANLLCYLCTMYKTEITWVGLTTSTILKGCALSIFRESYIIYLPI